jgi:hypothetical protein
MDTLTTPVLLRCMVINNGKASVTNVALPYHPAFVQVEILDNMSQLLHRLMD